VRFFSAIALILSLTGSDVERAQRQARASEAERARFHGKYTFKPGDPIVQQIEVVSEFRRMVLITEERLRQGDWLFSQSVRSGEEALRPKRGLLTISARLRFSPLNAYVTAPDMTIAISPADTNRPLAPIDTRTTPEYLSSSRGSAGAATLLGATLEADLRQDDIGQSVRMVAARIGGMESGRVTIDFSRIE
jgi:hypothetical protein